MIVPTNRLLIWMCLLLPLTVVGLLSPETASLSAVLYGLFFAVCIIDALASLSRIRAVTVSLPETVRMSKGRTDTVTVSIENSDPRNSLLTIGLPLPPSIHAEHEQVDVQLPSDSPNSSVDVSCTPDSRGKFTIDKCYFHVPSPAGLWNIRGSSDCNTEFRVYPNPTSDRRRLSSLFLNRGNFGLHTQRVVGQGREFEKLRDYVSGDSYDDIHWKATAKRGKPVTKLYQVERTQEVYVIVDSSRLSARQSGEETNLEHFLTAALVLGLVAEKQGDLFGLLTFNNKIETFIRAGGGKGHYNACRDSLYTITPTIESPDFEELASFVRLRIRHRSLLVILTDLTDPMLNESFLRNIELICRQHVVLVAMIKQPGIAPLFSTPDASDPSSLHHKLAGHMVWQNLVELEKQLHRKGVQLSFTDDERLSAEMVAQYMNVKARQLL